MAEAQWPPDPALLTAKHQILIQVVWEGLRGCSQVMLLVPEPHTEEQGDLTRVLS